MDRWLFQSWFQALTNSEFFTDFFTEFFELINRANR
jgi:hypothetical protein